MPAKKNDGEGEGDGEGDELLFLYGSQTGNTEQIAKGVCDEAVRERGYPNAQCHACDDFAKANFDKATVIVVLTSSTGDGEHPDNSVKFARHLKRRAADSLRGKHFTVLAIGDSNYSTFCGAGRRLHARFLELSAAEFYPRGEADDATGLDEVVEPWIEGLWPALQTLYAKIHEEQRKGAGSTDKAADTLQEQEQQQQQQQQGSSTFNLRKIKKAILHLPTLPLSPTGEPLPYTGIPHLMSSQFRVQWSAESREMSPQLKEGFSAPPVESVEDAQKVVAAQYSRSHPYRAQVLSVQCLTAPEAVKRTLKVSFLLDDPFMANYLPGDAFGVVCPNDADLVNAVIDRLGLQATMVFSLQSLPNDNGKRDLPSHIPRSCTVFEALSYHIDLTGLPKKSLLRVMAEYCTDASDKDLLLFLVSKQGSSDFEKFREQQPNMYDLLATFPSCELPFERLVEQRLPLVPRYYSAASSPLSHEKQLEVVFNVVRYRTPEPYNVERCGVATSHMDRLFRSVAGPIERERGVVDLKPHGIFLPVFPKGRSDFVVPSDLGQSMIMVGPGVGIAPFIGFLHHRRNRIRIEKVKGCLKCKFRCEKPEGCFSCFSSEQIGTAWLFSGCRNKQLDFLFERVLDEAIQDGTLSRLSSSFSRPAVDIGLPRYVQDAMRLHGKQLCELLLKKSAKIFVCGDVKGMGKDVENMFVEILQEHGKMTREDAQQTIREWIAEKRYLSDLW